MNNEQLETRLQQIEIENIIWIIYMIIIILSFYANEIEKNYFITQDQNSKKQYRDLMIFIFSILCIIYSYFTYDNWNNIKNLNPTDSADKIKFTYISWIATLLILISGLLFLYIVYHDEEIETEIAFN